MRGEYTATVNLKDRILTFENRVLSRSDGESFCYSSVEPLLEGGVLRREKVFAGSIPREHR